MKTLLNVTRLTVLQLLLVSCVFAQGTEQGPGPALAALVKQKQAAAPALPVGVSGDWYQQSADQLQKREYAIRAFGNEGTFAAANSKQKLAFMFTPEQYSVSNIKTKEGAHTWNHSFHFKGINKAGRSTSAPLPFKTFTSDKNTIEYHYANYTVQYVNGEQGMRQNFIVWKALEGSGKLEVAMELSGDLTPRVENNRLLMTSGDSLMMVYDGIKVWDANNRALAASMELRANNKLVLVVDDADAVYPVTIDPLNHAPDWTDSGSGLVFSLLDDLSVPLLYGFSVSGAGDINGDGFDDVIIGAPAYVDIINVSGGTFNAASVGAAFIYYGSASGLSSNPDEVLQPTDEIGALFGFSVSNAGDVNGDGKADVVVGAPGDKVSLTVLLNTVSVAVGKVYVYHSTTFDKNINTTPTVSATISLKQGDFGTLLTAPINPLYGFSVSTAGDVNGDGKADIVVGSPAYINLLTLTLAGRADVYHGSATGLSATPARTITGGLLNGLFGYSVSTAGKVNNDNYSDIIIGAPASINLLGVGAAYVFHGSATGITASSTSAANAALNAPGLLNKTLFGYSVSAAGDVNGDGLGDVIIGEPLALDLFSSSLVGVGKAHIYYGSNAGVVTTGRTQLTSPRKPGLLGLITGNLLFGYSVSGVKDVNCDGVDDVIIGEPGGTSVSLGTGLLGLVSANAVSGQAYIFYGKSSTGPIDNPGYTFVHQGGSLSAANLLGHSVKGSGDVNGDGKPDFVIGAPNGTLNLASSLTGILGNTLGYLTTNSVGTTYGYHGCINAAPVAANDNVSVNEDASVTFNIISNDSDPDGFIVASTIDLDLSTPGVQKSVTNSFGTWAVAANGDVTFTPLANFNGTATLGYVVKDNSGGLTNTATITVTVNPVNDAPVAVADVASGSEDSPVSVAVTTNDTDIDGAINTATVDLDPSTAGIQNTFTNTAGTWTVDVNGNVTLNPAANFNGAAIVSYTVNDNSGATSNIATITITLAAVNDAPLAVTDNVTVAEDNAITFNVTTNDFDIDGSIAVNTVDLDPSTVGIQNTFSTTAGNWSVDNNGAVTFTPALNFNGTASIAYTVNDNLGLTSNIATINVSVTAVNDPPVAVADSPTTDEDTPITFNVTHNDIDVDGIIDVTTVDLDPSTPGIQTTITNASGTWTVDNAGNVTYTPAPNFFGTGTATYTVNDNSGATSAPGTMSVTVNSVNDVPVANNDAASTNEDVAVTVNVVANDTDADGSINAATVDLDPSTVGIQSTFTSSGTWTVNASGVVSYTPAANVNGPVSISYTVNDNSGATSNAATISVTINAVNDAPVALDDNGSTNEDIQVSFSLTANDNDNLDTGGSIDVNTVDIDLTQGGIQSSFTNIFGTWNVTAGTLTFTPAADWSGTATASYTVNDNNVETSNVANITIIVAAVNDAPVAVNDNPSTSLNTPVTINVTSNDTDKDGTINSSTVDLNPSTPAIDDDVISSGHHWHVAADGKVTYTPATGASGLIAISYTVQDNNGATSNIATLTVNVYPGAAPANVKPVATNDNANTSQNVAVTFNITSNDTDSDGAIDASTVDLDVTSLATKESFVNTPSVGTWSVSTTGYLTFTPAPAFFGTATLSYRVQDNSGEWSGNNATISVEVNASPVAVDDNLTINEDSQASINVTLNDSDPGAGGAINVASVDLDPTVAGIQNTFTDGGTWSVDIAGNVTFTPTPNTFGSVSISYQVSDNQGALSNVATITINVTSVNDAPVAVNDNATTAEDNAVSFTVTTNDYDIDNAINVASVDLDPASPSIQNTLSTSSGDWSVNNMGSVTFTPALNFNGTASITYTVEDASNEVSNIATISVTVTAVNDAPVAVNDNPVTDEDSPVVFNVTNNDTDVDGSINTSTVDLDPSTPAIENTFSVPGTGSWTVAPNGNVTFTPVADYHGTAVITYTVQDDSGTTSNEGTISVTVNSINDGPVANNDVANGSEDGAVSVIVVANDTDADGTINPATVDLDPATPGIQAVVNTTQGVWSVDASGEVTFTPAANYNGTTSISYTVNDSDGTTSNAATITITIASVNDAPVAVNDNPSTSEDAVATFSVVANDTDADGTIDATTVDLDPSTPAIETSASTINGSWTVANGIVTFTPVADFFGAASVTYTVNDNLGAVSNIATISVHVTSVNDAPVAIADIASTPENIAVTLNITTNDTDVDGSINTASVDLDPSAPGIQTTSTTTQGSWIVAANGDLTFTPATSFFGTAAINYVVADNNGSLSNEASVTINIQWVNDAPIAEDDNGTTNEDVAITIDITANDWDFDGTIDLTSVHLDPATNISGRTTMNSAEGQWEVNSNGEVTFTPAEGFTGTVSVNYSVTDDFGLTSNEGVITITVLPVHDLITGLAKSVSTPELLSDGRMKATFTMTIESFSSARINDIQVTDDLAAAFPGALVEVENGSATGGLIFNTHFNGLSDINMLSSGSSIEAGETLQIRFDVIVDAQGNPATFSNSATLTVKSDDGTGSYTDISDEGTNPDNNGNNNPNDADESDATSIEFPVSRKMTVTKMLASEPVKNNDCTYSVWFAIKVKNTGNVNFTNIIATDNIGHGITEPSGYVIDEISSDKLIVNPAFDGKTEMNLLASGNMLASGDSAVIEYTVTIIPNDFYGPYSNTVEVKATAADGVVIEQASTPVNFQITPQEIFIPEGFSPNNDGNHDRFEITLSCGLTAELTVFNRWGHKVYHASNYQNDWDGTSNNGSFIGKLLPEGTYFYQIELSSGTKTTSFLTIKH